MLAESDRRSDASAGEYERLSFGGESELAPHGKLGEEIEDCVPSVCDAVAPEIEVAADIPGVEARNSTVVVRKRLETPVHDALNLYSDALNLSCEQWVREQMEHFVSIDDEAEADAALEKFQQIGEERFGKHALEEAQQKVSLERCAMACRS